jgi:hypothetical protein
MIDIAEAADVLRRYEKERDKRLPNGGPRDLVEEVRHVLDGGLSNNDFRALQKRAEDWAAMSKFAVRVTPEGLTMSRDAQPAPKNVFHRVGHTWEIAFAGRRTRLKDSDGRRYIHYLLERPNVPVDVQELRPLGSRQRPDPDVLAYQTRERSCRISDRQAVSQYTAELERLEQDIVRAHEAGDQAKADKLRTEHDRIEREQRQAHHPIDRVRKKAQEAVQKRIAAAIYEIAKELPLLAMYLRRSIKTGFKCQYIPDPARPIDWVLVPPDGGR